MIYEKFIEECLSKGLLKKQKCDFKTIGKLILRLYKDLDTAKALFILISAYKLNRC